MRHLCAQLQQKLQLDYKTSITRVNQKTELHGSLTTKDIKKPHSSRWVREEEMWRGTKRWRNEWLHFHMWWVKLGGIPQE